MMKKLVGNIVSVLMEVFMWITWLVVDFDISGNKKLFERNSRKTSVMKME